MYICPHCGASMKFVYQSMGGGYWICRTCGFVPSVTYSDHT